MIVREALGFVRGGDAKETMGIGREKLIGDFVEEMNKVPGKRFLLSSDDKTGVFLKAIEVGRPEIVRLLLSDPAVNPAVRKNAPIAVAAMNGNVEIIDMLLKDERVKPEDNHNEALYQAAKDGQLAVVQRLLQDPRVNPADAKESLDKNYNVTYEDNYIILETAANGHSEVVKELMKDPRVKIKRTIQLVASKLSKVPKGFSGLPISQSAIDKWSPILDYLLSSTKAKEELTDKEMSRFKEKINKV